MPELPEVEILVRHLRPLIVGRTIRSVEVRRSRVLAPTPVANFKERLAGARFLDVTRRAKYLRFEMRAGNSREHFSLLGHLGMTGRMYLAPKKDPLPKHAAVILDLGRRNFIYDDTRYFGRLTLDTAPLENLGPEPLGEDFTPKTLAGGLKRSRQPVKVKLLDQSMVAGIGNIYASEALFRAGISPRRPANRLTRAQVEKLWQAIREVLSAAIEFGSTVPLNFNPSESDGLFYYGSAAGERDFYTERLRIYDRRGKPCLVCATPVRRIVQAARSTFFCPHCQKA
ncbi:MAG: bifunctional DNA-formamidopyrimidine glycosylase/DNA-(apurinic or apyrimidinic site) lyase [Verrucomicrobiota bacterium]|jgi:formamidopyrimidine-DNA glycosylase